MKLLFVVQNIIGQGTYLRAFEFAKALQAYGHQVTILASSRDVRGKTLISKINNIEIIQVSDFLEGPTQAGWDLRNILSRNRILKSRDFDFDIVHGFESRPTVIYPALSMQRKGIPLFLDWADWFGKGGSVEERPNPIIRTFLRPVETYFENHFRNFPNGTTIICKTLENKALNLDISKDQICLLYNGFNLNGWKYLDVETAKQKCQIQQNYFTIGYLGSLFPDDAILLANAFNQLPQNFPNLRLIHAGRSKYRLHALIKETGALIETGQLDFVKMMTYLSACDILWLPFKNTLANQGRFPFKFSNYLSCGRPIVTTDVGDVAEFVKEYNTGAIVKDDPKRIAEVTTELLQNNTLRSIMGTNALDLSTDPNHSWMNRAEKLLSFYKKRT
jgi:glycosyltransferase involved in cell wall biosynthesis